VDFGHGYVAEYRPYRATEGVVFEKADLQALLGYNEKRTYDAVGKRTKKGEDDYAAAAEALHVELVERPSRFYARAAE
jgi:hypothetical protein